LAIRRRRRLKLRRLILCTTVGALALALLAAIAAAMVLTDPADQRLAARAQVRLTDLPAGWRITTSQEENGKSPCLARAVATATGKSTREFAYRDVANAYGRVGLFRTTGEAQHVFAVATGQKIWNCLTAQIKHLDGVTGTWQSRVPLQSIGAPAVGRELVVRVENAGATTLIGLHIVMFVHMSIGGPVFTTAQESLVLRRMVARLP
jgi:hypothetical protein